MMGEVAPIIATITGVNECSACGLVARLPSPVLALCRMLVKAGYPLETPLHAYRGSVLSLKVRSIGEGAGLRVATGGVGFQPTQERTTRSPALSPPSTPAPPARPTGKPLLGAVVG